MKNYNCMIEWNSHCDENDILSMKKKILECVKVKFWNVKNLELTYKEVGGKNDNRKKA